MGNAIKWEAGASEGSVLTTELNSLGDGSYSSAGPVYDNTEKRDKYFAAEIILASLNPTSGAFVQLHALKSLDGTNYEDPPSSTNPSGHNIVALMSVTTGTGAKRITTPEFVLGPWKYKFVLYSDVNVAMASSGNTVAIFSTNDEVKAAS